MDSIEVAKYTFNPNNPDSCKAYKLLVKIAQNKPLVYFSPTILKELLGKYIFNNKIKSELWDTPDNYDNLSGIDRLNLYKEQYSQRELEEFIDKSAKEVNRLFKYNFYEKIILLTYYSHLSKYYYRIVDENAYKQYLNKILQSKNIQYISGDITSVTQAIFFTNNELSFLNLDFEKSSIVVMPLENAELFYEKNKHNNVKPLFLKKLDDLELLLNVLENDLKKSNKNIESKVAPLTNLNIENFYSIKSINIDFKANKEIYIVGENGDGKTLLLQAIVIGLVGVNEGEVFDLVKSQKEFNVEIKDKNENIFTKNSQVHYEKILAYGASRYSYCQIKEDESGYLSLFSSSYDLVNPIEFLKYLDYKSKSEKRPSFTIKDIKNILANLLNKDIKIEVTPDRVEFIEKGSKVSFEQLSSGYKGVITIVCDIIDKLSKKEQNLKDISSLSGVVLIDEIDLHLHPKWKYSFLQKLRDIFPNIQFIVTTHSISVVSGANKDALFFRVKKDNGEIKVSEIDDISIDYISDIQNSIFDFDINLEKIESKKNQQEAKKSLLKLLEDSEDKK